MCGICGIFHYDKRQKIDPQNVKIMMDTIKHRGPDDEGQYISTHIGLGFRRLSIIDLEGGKQPMCDSEQKVWVIFNGEIYNFHSIKKELIDKGHSFRTLSDTEVIVYGYKEWGDEILNKLNGMFGLAIWDVDKERLVLARDRMGIKLLYYSISDSSLYFASEIRPLISNKSIDKSIDTDSINLFLRFRYTPSPNTIYKNIKKIAPGEMLIVENCKIKTKRWYNYIPVPFDCMPSIEEAKEQLKELYEESMKRHLISDVKIGLLLSGGIDSSLLLVLMKLYGNDWSTYTVGFGSEYKDDELEDASFTAKLMDVENYQIRIDQEVFENTLSDVVKYLEEPIASSSVVPMYHVCQRAKEDVKVALIGQGPDELFGGYTRHLGVAYGKYWRKIPVQARKQIKKFLIKLPRNESIKRGLYSLDENNKLERLKKVISILPKDKIDGLFKNHKTFNNKKLKESWSYLDEIPNHLDELSSLNYLEVRSTLPDELLMYADKLSMAHSIELRVPYLDYTIVEYVLKLNASFKVRYGNRKYLHKKLCHHYLPKKIIKRKKRGFAVNVVDQWFRKSVSGKFNDYLNDNKSYIFKYLKQHEVMGLLNEHIIGKSDNYKILYSIICLEEWLRTYSTE